MASWPAPLAFFRQASYHAARHGNIRQADRPGIVAGAVRLVVEVDLRHMDGIPADIQKVLEHISKRIERLDAEGEPEKSDRLRRVAALLQRGDFPMLTREECYLLAEWRGASRKLACLTEHRRLLIDKWLSACRLRLSTGPQKITEEQYEQWKAWVAANWAGPKTPVPAGLPPAGDDDDVIEDAARCRFHQGPEASRRGARRCGCGRRARECGR